MFGYYNLRDKELDEDIRDPELNLFLYHAHDCEFGKATSFPTTHLSSPHLKIGRKILLRKQFAHKPKIICAVATESA